MILLKRNRTEITIKTPREVEGKIAGNRFLLSSRCPPWSSFLPCGTACYESWDWGLFRLVTTRPYKNPQEKVCWRAKRDFSNAKWMLSNQRTQSRPARCRFCAVNLRRDLHNSRFIFNRIMIKSCT